MMSHERPPNVGRKSFKNDENRGKWSHPKDFIFACAGLAFRSEAILPLYRVFGLYSIIYYFLFLAVCVVPVHFIQSFLGQFSGTGFISAFRIAPIFKVIGYISFILNVASLVYYIISSAVPLFLFVHVLLPTISWSCDESRDWMKRRNYTISPCDVNGNFDEMNFILQVPSMTFFYSNEDLKESAQKKKFVWTMFLWSTLVCLFVVPIALRSVETVGRFSRFSYLSMIGLMSILLVRFLLLPGALSGLHQFFIQPKAMQLEDWFVVLHVALSTLGPGWGSTITMASFNDFKTNIYGCSWVLSCVQFFVMFGFMLLSVLMRGFLFTPIEEDALQFSKGKYSTDFHLIPTGLGLIDMPRFWLLLFFGMLFLGSLNCLVVQLMSILTTLFDEFEELRSNKRVTTLAFIGILVLNLQAFCTPGGFHRLFSFMQSAFLTQILFNLLMLVSVLGVYGRDRLQRDILFMTDRTYSNRMMVMTTFFTSIVLFVATVCGDGNFCYVNLLLLGFKFMELFLDLVPTSLGGANVFLIAMLMFAGCLLTCCCIFQCVQSILLLKRYFRPTDWYPADPVHRQRYEEIFGASDTSIPTQV